MRVDKKQSEEGKIVEMVKYKWRLTTLERTPFDGKQQSQSRHEFHR
jgi:hypothetical protein